MQRASYAIFSSLQAGKGGEKDDEIVARSPANFKNGTSGSPAPTNPTTTEYSDDEARQIVEALEKKRKQLDDEIERFKKQKNREFKEFETELRSSKARKNGKGRDGQEKPEGNGHMSHGVNGAENRTLKSKSKDPLSSDIGREKARKDGLPPTIKRRTGSINELTDSLNRLNTNGIPSSSSKSENNNSVKGPRQAKGQDAPMTTSIHDRDAEFQGLFTPSYLPLIDQKNNGHNQSSSSPTSQKLPLPLPTSINRRLTPSPSSSFPPQSISNLPHPSTTALHSDSTSKTSSRSSLAPSLDPSSLPSALRTPTNKKGKNKKSRSPKRVQFQLATAIVQPNSSYEEPRRPSTSKAQEQNQPVNMPPKAMYSTDDMLSLSPTQEPDSSEERLPLSDAVNTSSPSTESDKPFKRSPTSPPTPSTTTNNNTSTAQSQSQPPEDFSSCFDAAMSKAPSPPLKPPREEPEMPEESGDPLFDLDEDMDSPGNDSKYIDEDEKEQANASDLSPDDEDGDEVLSPGLSGGQAGSLPINILGPPRGFRD